MSEQDYGAICPQFKWIYGYENDRDAWVTQKCHWCLNLNEKCLELHIGRTLCIVDKKPIHYLCQFPDREAKKNAWNAAQAKGQTVLVASLSQEQSKGAE